MVQKVLFNCRKKIHSDFIQKMFFLEKLLRTCKIVLTTLQKLFCQMSEILYRKIRGKLVKILENHEIDPLDTWKSALTTLLKFFSQTSGSFSPWSPRNFKILCSFELFFLKMFFRIAKCSSDHPAEIFVPKARLYSVESLKKVRTNEFFQKNFFSSECFLGSYKTVLTTLFAEL